MKKHTVRSLSHRAAALVLALALALPTVYAHAGEQKLQTSIDLVDGLTYRNTITDNSERRVEGFSLELRRTATPTPSCFRLPAPFTAPLPSTELSPMPRSWVTTY